MNLLKISLFVVLIYFLALFQSSFLVHFNIFGFVPNIIFIIAVLWNIVENPKSYFGFFVSGISGFVLDVFSSHTIGFYIIILLLISLAIKTLFSRYVRVPFNQNI